MNPVKELLLYWRADPDMTAEIAMQALGYEGCASTSWVEVEIVAATVWKKLHPPSAWTESLERHCVEQLTQTEAEERAKWEKEMAA